MNERIRGVLAPVLTPFAADLSPDSKRFVAHCRWLISQNCGLAPFGTTSEANSMSTDERIDLLETLLASGIDPTRMMPGTGCCSLTETVKLTAHAVKHGCAGVLMLPPFYYKEVGDEGLFRYFSEVVQRVGDSRLRIYLYHIPPVAKVGITPALVERLLKAYPDAIAGMKDSSGDWNNTKIFLDAFAVRPSPGTKLQTPSSKSRGSTNLENSQTQERVEAVGAARTFDVFVGSESFLLENMRHGGAGTISATANVNPAAIHKLYSDWKADDVDQQQTALDGVREIFANKKFSSLIAALKAAVAMERSDPEWARVRPPLIGLTDEQTEMLRAELGLLCQ